MLDFINFSLSNSKYKLAASIIQVLQKHLSTNSANYSIYNYFHMHKAVARQKTLGEGGRVANALIFFKVETKRKKEHDFSQNFIYFSKIEAKGKR